MQITVLRTSPLASTVDNADRRYERKLLIGNVDRSALQLMVRHHPAMFREIFYRRWINNIYLDTPGLNSYDDNVSGVSENRVKVRIRWYGDLRGEVERPVLELKIKRGWVNWKLAFPLPAFVMDDQLSTASIKGLFRSAELPEGLRQELFGLMPTLVNRYSRNYFQSRDRAFRLTIDSHLAFHGVNAGGRPTLHRWWDTHCIVLELKYPEHHDENASTVLQHFPFRLTRSSKYATGIDAVRGTSGSEMIFSLRREQRMAPLCASSTDEANVYSHVT